MKHIDEHAQTEFTFFRADLLYNFLGYYESTSHNHNYLNFEFEIKFT